jgi:hypothetical protein
MLEKSHLKYKTANKMSYIHVIATTERLRQEDMKARLRHIPRSCLRTRIGDEAQ